VINNINLKNRKHESTGQALKSLPTQCTEERLERKNERKRKNIY
jgi:hypothetical protein